MSWAMQFDRKSVVRAWFAIIACFLSTLSHTSAQVLTFDQAKQRADAGDPFAQAVVALHYQLGWNAQKNSDLAARYALASAKASHPLGQFRLGALLRAGDGAPKDEEQGLALQAASFNALHDAQDPYSITSAAIMIFQGKVVGQNVPEDNRRRDAAALYKKAADMGYAPAQFNYAMCAAAGHGIPKDDAVQAEFLNRAASNGYPLALGTNDLLSASEDGAPQRRDPEPLTVEQKHDDYVESWSYEFIPTDKSILFNLQDAAGEIVYADDKWIVTTRPHFAKIAFKSLFDLYFYDAKTLQLVSAVRAPNNLKQIDRIASGNLFAVLSNASSKPSFCLGSPAFVLIDPASQRIEKFDIPNNGWRDNVSHASIRGKKIDVFFDPEQGSPSDERYFSSNIFEDVAIRIAGYRGSDLRQRRDSDRNGVPPPSGNVDSAKAGLSYVGKIYGARPSPLSSSDEDAERWWSSHKRGQIVNASFVQPGTPWSGVNLVKITPQGKIRLLNLSSLQSQVVVDQKADYRQIGMTSDGTLHFERDGELLLYNSGKVTSFPAKDSDIVIHGNRAFAIPKDRGFGVHFPHENDFNPPPLTTQFSVLEFTTGGAKRELRLVPNRIEQRFFSGKASESDAGYSYWWDFFPECDAVVIAERRSLYGPVVSYRMFRQKQESLALSLKVRLGLEAAQDIRLAQPSNGWMPMSLLTNFYNIGPSYSILLWNDELQRCFGVEGDLSAHPDILRMHWKDENQAYILSSSSDTIRLVKFNPSEAKHIKARPSVDEHGNEKTLGAEYPLETELIQEWVASSVELPPLYLEAQSLLFVPISSGYKVYRLFSSERPAELCEVYFAGESGYAIRLPNGMYCGSPTVEAELVRSANPRDGVDASTLAPWRNRPAEVAKAIDGDPEQIAVLERVTQRWLKRLGHPEKSPEPRADEIPTIELAEEVPLWAENDRLTMRFRALSGGRAPPSSVLGAVGSLLGGSKPSIARVSVRVNGVEQAGALALEGSDGEWSQEVKLAEGQNWIEASAIDAKGHSSNLLRFRVLLAEAEAPARRYIIALGVSEYQESGLNLAYAAKDAQDVASTLGVATDDAKTLVLLNNEVTKSSLARVEEFLKEARENDEVIVFCAGHGVLDENLDYVFASHDFDPARPAETGIKLDDLIDTIGKSKSLKRLLLLDTCHAGQVGEREEILLAQASSTLPKGVRAVQQRGMSVKPVEGLSAESQQRFIEEMFSLPGLHRGINVIGASGGAEFALESDKWNNGVFSASLIEALRDKKADANSDGRVGVAELRSYLADRVPKLTGGAQKPSVVAFERDQDFDLVN